jgi:hypothetical protein
VLIVLILIIVIAETQIMIFTFSFGYALSGPVWMIYKLSRRKRAGQEKQAHHQEETGLMEK